MLVNVPDSRSKGCEFESRQERRENFLLQSQLCVLIRCPFHPRVTAVTVKHPGNFTKSAGDWLHLNTYTPSTERSRSGLTMPLSRYSVEIYQATNSHATRQGNSRPQSSQLAEPLWTDPGLKSEISVRELISIQKKKKCRRGSNAPTFPQIFGSEETSHYHRVSTALLPQKVSQTPQHVTRRKPFSMVAFVCSARHFP